MAHIDWSDNGEQLGDTPNDGDDLELHTPTNNQSSEKRIRRAVNAVIDLFTSGEDE